MKALELLAALEALEEDSGTTLYGPALQSILRGATASAAELVGTAERSPVSEVALHRQKAGILASAALAFATERDEGFHAVAAILAQLAQAEATLALQLTTQTAGSKIPIGP